MSKYPKNLLLEMEKYCIDINLDSRLIHIPRTKDQADELKNIQFDCEVQHNPDYSITKRDDSSNPYRENSKALNDIDALKKHLLKYHMGSEIEMISKLQQLKKRLDIDNRIKPKDVLDERKNQIIHELQLAGFKDTLIHENILPVFVDMIKNL